MIYCEAVYYLFMLAGFIYLLCLSGIYGSAAVELENGQNESKTEMQVHVANSLSLSSFLSISPTTFTFSPLPLPLHQLSVRFYMNTV